MENNQHKDLDKFFQKKLDNRAFEYQDDFWDEMETLLPKSDSDVVSSGNTRQRWIIGVFLLCLTGLMGWLAYPQTEKNTSITSNTSSTAELEKADFSAAFKDNSNNKQELIPANDKNANVSSNTAKTADINTKAKSNNIDVNNRNNVNDNLVSKSKQINADQEIGKTEGKTPNSALITTTSITQNSNTEESIVANKDESPNMDVGNSSKVVKSQNPQTALTTIFNKTNKTVNKGGNNQTEVSSVTKLKFLSNKPIALTTKSATKNININEPNCEGCPFTPTFHRLKIGLSAGLSASQGLKNAVDFRASPSFDPTVGLRLSYQHSLVSDWSTHAEVLYWSRSSLNAQIGYDSTTYGFGATIVSRTINIEELHYINIPIYVVYTKKQHQFMGGLSFNYLLNAQSTTQGTVQTATFDALEFAAEPTTQQWGYTAAFNRLDVGLTLGYDYEVAAGWKIGTRINYGFVDLAKDAVFNRQSFDNNLNVRILLTTDLMEYNISKR